MSLSQKIAAEVADALGAASHNVTLHAHHDRHTLDIPLILATAMGIECQGLDLSVDDRDNLSLDDLKDWGARIAARVTYLMEPLAIIEADAMGGQVLLRSGKPTPRAGKRSYYEVRLRKAGNLTLARVAYDDATRTRQDVPCQFTKEVLERLTDDLVATSA